MKYLIAALATAAACEKPFTYVDSVPAEYKFEDLTANDNEFVTVSWSTSLVSDVKSLKGTAVMNSATVLTSAKVALHFKKADENNCNAQYIFNCASFANKDGPCEEA